MSKLKNNFEETRIVLKKGIFPLLDELTPINQVIIFLVTKVQSKIAKHMRAASGRALTTHFLITESIAE